MTTIEATQFKVREVDPAEKAARAKRYAQQQVEYRARSADATEKGAVAFGRLLALAETRDSGQIEKVAAFIGACWNGKRHFDLFDLRAVDAVIGDDMLAVLEALRWGQRAIENMVPEGNRRIVDMLTAWGMYGRGQAGQFICTRD
jgi:hypothetical protein